MTCQRCGMPAQGDRCASCRQVAHNEERHGTPAENMERRDDREADDE